VNATAIRVPTTMYETLRVRLQESVCFVQLYRPHANNTIDPQLISELNAVLAECAATANVVVLEGLPEVFCFGADFQQLSAGVAGGRDESHDPGPLYDVWEQLASGPYVTIAHVRGKANAGGVGFVAACDIVIADESAQFSLSELLFGVYPACVLPFLIRRIGFQKAHYLTLMTQPITVQQAHAWGLVDAFEPKSDVLLRKHLLRLRRLSKVAIRRYKQYMNALHGPLSDAKSLAVAGNKEAFSDPANIAGIVRYVEQGIFPWEAS
jgi:polyketide biosynthesis enoyl-CoA hydratase PksH